MTLLGKSTEATSDARAFLQRRVGLFGLVAGSCYLFFLLYRVTSDAPWRTPQDPSLWYHLASALIFLSVWVVCRTGSHSIRTLRLVESLGLLLGSGAIVLMGGYIPLYARPDQVLLLALSAALTARAIYVPSSARRTLWIAVAVGLELLIGVFFMYRKIEPARWAAISPDLPARSTDEIALLITVNTAAWWAITIAIATGASRVIYGLRREIRDAKQLGQYRLEHKLGDGGMGTVYRASHALLRRPTAIKLLRPERATDDELRRFESEVQHTARLSHPNIVTIFDYGHTADGVFYYAMELLEGATLERLVDADGAQPVGRVLGMLKQIGAALVHAHGDGLIHRDVKPANIGIFLPHRHGGQSEQIKLLDFGLVKEVKDTGGIEVTHAGSISGTPQYMSPEAVLDSENMDGRSDLYAVGAVAFYLLTGRHLFEGDSLVEVLGHHMHTEAPRTSTYAPDRIPEALDDLIARCLDKSPDERPTNALAFLDDLRSIPDTAPWTPTDALAWWERMDARVTPVVEETGSDKLLTIDLGAEAREG